MTLLNPAQRKVVFRAWLSEVQAIAIYEIEIAVLKRYAWTKEQKLTLSTFHKILTEELQHSGSLNSYFSLDRMEQVQVLISRFIGMVIGCVLSILPSRVSWIVHAAAEKQAALIYSKAYSKVPLEELKQAHHQELEHSALFEDLLKLRHG